MKQIFEFDTGDENYDYHEHQVYIQAPKMVRALSDIQAKIKNWYKWDERTHIPDEEIMDTINSIILDNGVDMESIGY